MRGRAEGKAFGSFGIFIPGVYFIPMGINSRVERAYHGALASYSRGQGSDQYQFPGGLVLVDNRDGPLCHHQRGCDPGGGGMKTVFRDFMVVVALSSLIGCSGVPVHIPNVPDHAVDWSRSRHLVAGARGFQLLFIPIMTNSRHERAYQALLKEADGDFITDTKVQEFWWYAYIGTIYSTTMEATAYPRLKRPLPVSETSEPPREADASGGDF